MKDCLGVDYRVLMFSNILLGPCPNLPVFPLELQERSEELYQNLKVKGDAAPVKHPPSPL